MSPLVGWQDGPSDDGMTPHVGVVAISIGFARRHKNAIVLLLVLAGAMAGVVVGLATIRDSAQRSITDSLRADLGQKQFALQTSDPKAMSILGSLQDASPVRDDVGDVSVGDLSAPVLTRTTTDKDLQLGVVTTGSSPDQTGEIALTASTASALGVGVGDNLVVTLDGESSTGRVVGLLVDPADRDNQTLVRLVEPANGQVWTRWLSDTSFYSVASLRPYLDRGSASFQSLDNLLEGAAANSPEFLSAMRFLPTGAGLLLALVMVSFAAVMLRRWTSDVEALVATGMSRAEAWRRLLIPVLVVVLAGEAIGAVAAVLSLFSFRFAVSSWFGQSWVSLGIPLFESIVLAAATAVAAVAALPLLRVLPAAQSWASNRSQRSWRWATPIALVCGTLAALTWLVSVTLSGPAENDTFSNLVGPAALVFLASAPFILAPILTLGLSPAIKILLENMLRGLVPVSAVASIVAVLATMWCAQTTYNANQGEASSSPLVPSGAFVISSVPAKTVETVKERYRTTGGRKIAEYRLLNEKAADLRVTTLGIVDCLAAPGVDLDSMPDDCWPPESATASPINLVAVGAPGSRAQADPGLLNDGIVGLLLLTGEEGRITKQATTRAEPDPTLGGSLPGLIVPPDSNVLREFDVSEAGSSMLVLLDFDQLTIEDRLRVRSLVLRLAPGAEVADGTDPTAYDRLRSVANTVGLLGSAASVGLVLLGGMAMVVSNALTRRILVDLGTRPSIRWTVAIRWTALMSVPLALAVPLGIASASYAGRADGASYGLLWPLPGLLGFLASVVIGIAFLRVPPPDNE